MTAPAMPRHALLRGSLIALLAAVASYANGAPNQSDAANEANPGLNGKAINEKQLSGNALNGKALQEMYGGIVTDQTITVAGQDFYQQFVAQWRDKPMSDRVAIAIRERPSARWGNEIWVEFAQRRVFQAVLPANRSNIKALSERASEIAYKNVFDLEVQRLLFRDPDLGQDEF